MQMSGITIRHGIAGVLAAGALGGLAATTIALPTASADADCTVSGLSKRDRHGVNLSPVDIVVL